MGRGENEQTEENSLDAVHLDLPSQANQALKQACKNKLHPVLLDNHSPKLQPLLKIPREPSRYMLQPCTPCLQERN